MQPMGAQFQRLQHFIDTEIPIARAMGVTIKHFGPDGLVLAAPLRSNMNNKGTAFAGSLASIATLSGWALTQLVVEGMGMSPEVVASQSHIDYLKPVGEDIEAVCAMPSEAATEKLRRMLSRKGIGRWELEARIHAGGVVAVAFTGTYVVTVVRA